MFNTSNIKQITISSTILFLILVSFGIVNIPIDAMTPYKIPDIENAKYVKLTKNTSLIELAKRYQAPLSEDVLLAEKESKEIKLELAKLSPDELIAFKRITRQSSDLDMNTNNGRKKNILMEKFERDLVRSFQDKFGTGKTQYNISDNDKKSMDYYVKDDKNLVDLIQKYQNPDLISDSALNLNTQAVTMICGTDNNWPSSISVGAYNWQGPTFWYNPTGSGDARNSWTPSDTFCDFKVWGVPNNMVAVHGRNYQGSDAIDCWSSLIARSNKNETMSGSVCAIGAGIWHHWDLKNNIRFRRNY